jgi:hypothetical protein
VALRLAKPKHQGVETKHARPDPISFQGINR